LKYLAAAGRHASSGSRGDAAAVKHPAAATASTTSGLHAGTVVRHNEGDTVVRHSEGDTVVRHGEGDTMRGTPGGGEDDARAEMSERPVSGVSTASSVADTSRSSSAGAATSAAATHLHEPNELN
jgi:hypothetical protein